MARFSVEHVLCPTDHSDFSERALRHAIALCRWFGPQLSVLRVIPDVMPHPSASRRLPLPPRLWHRSPQRSSRRQPV